MPKVPKLMHGYVSEEQRNKASAFSVYFDFAGRSLKSTSNQTSAFVKFFHALRVSLQYLQPSLTTVLRRVQ